MLSSCFPSFFSRDQAKAYEKLAKRQRDAKTDEKENIRQMLVMGPNKGSGAAKRPFADLTNTAAAGNEANGSTMKKMKVDPTTATIMSPTSALMLSAEEIKMKQQKKAAAKKALAALKERSRRQLQKAIKKEKTITLSDSDLLQEDDGDDDPESDEEEDREECCDDEEDAGMEGDIKKEKAAVMVAAADQFEDHINAQQRHDLSQEVGVECESDDDDEIGVEVDDIDEEDADEPENCGVYVREIYEHLHRRQRPASDYLQTRQEGELTEKMRALTVNWMVEAAGRCDLLTETLFLAVDLFDRFLSLKKVSQRRVQLIAITCLFVASKYEEIYYPTLKDFEWLSNGTISGRDIVKAESIVLAALGFDLASVNPFHFIRRFSKAAHSSRRTHELTKYVMELSLGVYSMLGHKPSVVAAACVYIARAMTHQSPIWTPTLVHFTRCDTPRDQANDDSTFDSEDDSESESEDDDEYDAQGRRRDKGLMECVRAINALVLAAEEDPADPRIAAVRSKYAQVKHHSVAFVPAVDL